MLRESARENKQDESLRPYGPLQATTAHGQRVAREASWYHYLGDMHIRLMFDGPRTLQSASPDDLARLQLTPDEHYASRSPTCAAPTRGAVRRPQKATW